MFAIYLFQESQKLLIQSFYNTVMEHLLVLQSCTTLGQNCKIWPLPLENVQYTNTLTHVGYSNYDFLFTTSLQSAWYIVNTQ